MRGENDADGRGSFAAAERSMSTGFQEGKWKLTESAKEFPKDSAWQSPIGPFREALERKGHATPLPQELF
jgi:hypothetical protein